MFKFIDNIKEKINRRFSNDIGIDLGTANTLVYLGVSLFGKPRDLPAMLGRTPPHIVAVRPLVDGVISDFEVTEEMIAYLVKKAEELSSKPLGPRVVVGVPSGVTNVEIRAVRDATRNPHCRLVWLKPRARDLCARCLDDNER